MTKAYSTATDNGGRCERCDRPESANEPQSTVEVRLGGGLGIGTMWVCKTCAEERAERLKENTP